MPKVWIANLAGHDYSQARQYGDLRVITEGHINLKSLDRLFYDVASKVSSSSEDDWLVPSGLIMLNTLIGSVWWAKHQSLNLLLWDRKKGRYREMRITEPQMSDLLERLNA